VRAHTHADVAIVTWNRGL